MGKVRNLLLVLAAFAPLMFTGCGKNAGSVDDTTTAVESGVTAMTGSADDQSNVSGFAYRAPRTFEKVAHRIEQILLPFAMATGTCARPITQSCTGSPANVRSASYVSCSAFGGLISFDGTITLSYSSASVCSGGLVNTGDSVTRTMDYTLTGVRGANLHVFTTAQTDYNSNTIAGGSSLTKTASGWNIAIAGKNKILTGIDGNTVFNHSIYTSQPIAITGGLARASRTVNGGTLNVEHNLAKWTAALSPVNLTYSNSCCQPVGGSINVVYSGTKSGTGTVTFNGCGNATFSDGGTSKTLNIGYCE